MKIATWNVNSLKVRLPHLLKWLEYEKPDVVALQETKLVDEAFPVAAIEEAGYAVMFHGQKTYNGVATLSKIPLTDPEATPVFFPDQQSRLLAVTCDDMRIVNVYVPNGQSVGSDKYAYKLAWLDALYRYLNEALAKYKKLIVLGDFNIAPEDMDVHDPIAWEGSVLVSESERVALQKNLSLGLLDAFRLGNDGAGFYSWWDYRQAAFRRNMGLRIDLILVSKALQEACKTCYIDKTPRQLERPSDHVPVILELKY